MGFLEFKNKMFGYKQKPMADHRAQLLLKTYDL
jgi:hypothetical protein